MKEETKYETPLIETIEVNIEKGFATSGGGDGTATVPDGSPWQ